MDAKNTWQAFMNGGEDLFKIKKGKNMQDFHGTDDNLNNSFDHAMKWFDSKEHESMTRRPLKDEEVRKMVDPVKVVAGCFGLGALKKTVDILL